MNSTILLVSLISFVSLCQGQITSDGTAAVAAILPLLSADATQQGYINTGLDLAMPKKTADEQTTLKDAAALISGTDIKLLGADVIAAATAAVAEAMASNFLDRVLVTYKLDKALGLDAGPIENKAIKALSVAIGPKVEADTIILKDDLALLSDAQIKTEGTDMIKAAQDDTVTPIPLATTTAFLKSINDATAANRKTTVDKLVNALNKVLEAAAKAKISDAIPTGYDALLPAAQVVLQKSTGNLNEAPIQTAGAGMMVAANDTDVTPIPPATTTAFFTAIDAAAAAASKVTTDKLAKALFEGLSVIQETKITTAITRDYDTLASAEQVKLQISTAKLNDAQIKVAGKDMIAAAKIPALARTPIPDATVFAFFKAINDAAAATNSLPVTQCSVTLLIATVAGAALYRSIGSL